MDFIAMSSSPLQAFLKGPIYVLMPMSEISILLDFSDQDISDLQCKLEIFGNLCFINKLQINISKCCSVSCITLFKRKVSRFVYPMNDALFINLKMSVILEYFLMHNSDLRLILTPFVPPSCENLDLECHI